MPSRAQMKRALSREATSRSSGPREGARSPAGASADRSRSRPFRLSSRFSNVELRGGGGKKCKRHRRRARIRHALEVRGGHIRRAAPQGLRNGRGGIGAALRGGCSGVEAPPPESLDRGNERIQPGPTAQEWPTEEL